MAMSDQNVKLILDRNISSDSESEGVPSAYGYDTSSDVDTPKKSKMHRKTFKPSHKKKMQLTFEDLTVKTIPIRKKFLLCEYGEPTQSKTILDKVSGTFIPGQFTAILGSSGKHSLNQTAFYRKWKDMLFELPLGQNERVGQDIEDVG